MAITATDLNAYPAGWIVNATSADASGCEVLKAAPGAGLSLHIDRLTVVSSSATLEVTVGAGETASAVTSPIAGPLYLTAGRSVEVVFDRPHVMAANTALTVDASGAGAVCVVAQGTVK